MGKKLSGKMSKLAFSQCLLEVFVLLQVFAGISFASDFEIGKVKCGIIIDISEEFRKVFKDCYKSNKPDETKFIDLNWNITLEEFDLNDNCYSECLYKSAKIMTPDGLNKELTATLFSGENVSPETLAKVADGWDSCIDDSEKIGKSKGFDQCKLAALHDFCFTQKRFENRKNSDVKC